jgi:hypothetical protein
MIPIKDIEINNNVRPFRRRKSDGELDKFIGYFWLSIALVFVFGLCAGMFIEHRVEEAKQAAIARGTK